MTQISTYDLNIAFWEKLGALTYSGMKTLRPDEIFDPKELNSTTPVRRGFILLNDPGFRAFGHGVYSRIEGIYQIDIWLPRATTSALQTIKQMSDAHVAHFFPANGRGLTLTENTTSANIHKRPAQKDLGREGSYLREMIEVDFFVDEDPSA